MVKKNRSTNSSDANGRAATSEPAVPPQGEMPPPPPADDDMLRDFISFEGFSPSPEPEPSSRAESSRSGSTRVLPQPHPSLPLRPHHGESSNSSRRRDRDHSYDTSEIMNGRGSGYRYNTYQDVGSTYSSDAGRKHGRSERSKGKKRKVDEMQADGDELPRKSSERQSTRMQMPWCDDIDWLNEPNGIKLFNAEILASAKWIAPTPEEHVVRDRAIRQVKSAIISRWSRAQVHVFGSHETQLYLPGGNMIFRRVQEFFEPTIAALSRNGVILAERIKPVERVYHAKVPIIKIVTAEGNIKIDISLNMTNGVQAGMIVKEYLSAMPAVRPLVLLLKAYMWRMDAHEVFNGGLGSYSIICLVISFLQQHPKIRRGEIDPIQNLGTLLIEFFELYGIKFNWRLTGISIVHGGRYFDKSTSFIGQQSLSTRNASRLAFCLEDPQNADNDITKGSWDTSYILDVFSKAFHRLTQSVAERSEELAYWIRHGSDHRAMPPDWLDSAGDFEPSRMSLLAGVVGFDRPVLDHRAELISIFHRRGLKLPADLPMTMDMRISRRTAKTIPPPPPPPAPSGSSSMAAIMVGEDPATAHREDPGYFSSDDDDDGDDGSSDVVAIDAPEDKDEGRPTLTAKAKRRKEKRMRKQAAKRQAELSDDEIQIVEQPETGKKNATPKKSSDDSKVKAKNSSKAAKEKKRASSEDVDDDITGYTRPSTSAGNRIKGTGVPVIHFSETTTKNGQLSTDDVDALAPQFANPDPEPNPSGRPPKKLKTNDKRAYWEGKSGKDLHQTDTDTASASTLAPSRDRGRTTSALEQREQRFNDNWRQMAEDSARKSLAGKDEISTNADFISLDDL